MLESSFMSDRLYYTDSYTREFSAYILELEQGEQGVRIVLDQTYFYPTSGGQPHDSGSINGVPVLAVEVRKEDGAVVHVLEQEPESKEVSAVIDWERRFDHMQQHSGQHILSQAFIRIAGADTIGFHLSADTVTLDLDIDNLGQAMIDQAEQLANQVVWQNQPIIVRWVSRAEAESLSLRKIPANGDDNLRLIDIADFDLTACGGTHVARTGEIGLIKVIKTETRGNKARVEFRCGKRALNHYRSINQVIRHLSSLLTTAAEELGASVTKLQENEKQTRRTLKQLQTKIDGLEAQQLLQSGQRIGDNTLVIHVYDGDSPGRIRALAGLLAKEEGVIALLAASGDRTHLVFSRADEAPGDMKTVLQEALRQLESGSGGGSNTFAQGAAESASGQSIRRAIEVAADRLLEEMHNIR